MLMFCVGVLLLNADDVYLPVAYALETEIG